MIPGWSWWNLPIWLSIWFISSLQDLFKMMSLMLLNGCCLWEMVHIHAYVVKIYAYNNYKSCIELELIFDMITTWCNNLGLNSRLSKMQQYFTINIYKPLFECSSNCSGILKMLIYLPLWRSISLFFFNTYAVYNFTYNFIDRIIHHPIPGSE